MKNRWRGVSFNEAYPRPEALRGLTYEEQRETFCKQLQRIANFNNKVKKNKSKFNRRLKLKGE